MQNLRVVQPVSHNSIDNITKMMAVGSVKVEIYGRIPLFTLFKKDFFVKERKFMTYYMGPATQSNIGNFAIMEGHEDMPCIVYIPGFRGFVTPRYSPFAQEWYSHRLFQTKLTRIQEVIITDYEHPYESFRVEKTGPRFFNLYDASNTLISQYDTTKIINFMADFREKNYENLANVSPSERDSIIENNLYKSIQVIDVNGNKTTLFLYKMMGSNESLDELDHIEEVEVCYNRDRCYATLNDDKQQLFTVQYYHFDRLLQPLSYFKITKDEHINK
jgi:hypothetical protein